MGESKKNEELKEASGIMTDYVENEDNPSEQKKAYEEYLDIDEKKAENLTEIEQSSHINESLENISDEELEQKYEEALNTDESKRSEMQTALLEQTKERYLKIKFYKEFEESMKWFENEYPDKDFKEIITSELFTEFASGIKLPLREILRRFMMMSEQKSEKKVTSPGSVKTAGATLEKDYFSPAEVDRMSEEEISKNLEKIKKSMRKWK